MIRRLIDMLVAWIAMLGDRDRDPDEIQKRGG
jgi:hypothetical protein